MSRLGAPVLGACAGPDQQRRPRPRRSPRGSLRPSAFRLGPCRAMQWCPIFRHGRTRRHAGGTLRGRARARPGSPGSPDSASTAYGTLIFQVSQQCSSALDHLAEWIESPSRRSASPTTITSRPRCRDLGGAHSRCTPWAHRTGPLLWSVYPRRRCSSGTRCTRATSSTSAPGTRRCRHWSPRCPWAGSRRSWTSRARRASGTYVGGPGSSSSQRTLDWSDHLQGWLALAPSGGAGLNTVVFLSVRYFPVAKRCSRP